MLPTVADHASYSLLTHENVAHNFECSVDCSDTKALSSCSAFPVISTRALIIATQFLQIQQSQIQCSSHSSLIGYALIKTFELQPSHLGYSMGG